MVRISTLYGDGTVAPLILAHELGHNLGLYHANYFDCQAAYTVAGTSCMSDEYGDPIEVMGSRYHDFNAIHKELLGWIKPVTVTESGSHYPPARRSPYSPLCRALIFCDD